MPVIQWFLFDLGNVLVKLAYERVIATICSDSDVDREELLGIFESPGGYRDMERGAVSFNDFYELLRARAGYRGTNETFRRVWQDFFDGPVPGIEEVLERVRERYRVAFLSNSNEVHAELIPRQFAALFASDDRFIFSHRFGLAKPDPELFHRALELIGAPAEQVVFIDDILENVDAARAIGMRAYQFTDSLSLLRALEADGTLTEE
jgi:HAD superfamily hydrolase (TIGR01509 family)